jgi:hypothetical protein
MVDRLDLCPGEIMVVIPGEKIPTDDIIVAGQSSIAVDLKSRFDTSAQTPLSPPSSKLVEEAQATRVPVQHLADQISASSCLWQSSSLSASLSAGSSGRARFAPRFATVSPC